MPKASPALQITVDGETFVIEMENLTARDAREFRHAVGVSLAQAMYEGSADLDVVAGLIWLVKRKRDPRLRFADVERSITYGSDLEVSDGDTEEKPDPGEA